MKHRQPLWTWVGLILLIAAAPALASGDANLLFGQKSLSDDLLDSAGVDGQSQFGVAVSLDFDWPVALAIDLLSSSKDDRRSVVTSFPLLYETDVETLELDLGVRKLWGDRWQPYVGGGVALVQLEACQTMSGTLGPGASFTDVIVDDSDSGIGLWVNAGLLYRAGRNINLGLDLRYSDAEASLDPLQAMSTLDLDSGGTHVGLMLGYHW